ncbi:MAG: hypothetical protein CMH53_09280, partial [Myxococcales bacterium]|nr:hypothetical protein [Myxococcales bacterium]
LEEHFDAIHYVQTPRFGEMLPFFVAAAVSNFESTPRLRASLLVRLTRDSDEPERFERSIQSLCPKQRAAVVSTLGYLLGVIRQEQNADGLDWIDSRDNPARPALQSFWT